MPNTCLKCDGPIVQTPATRPMKFCSKKCRRQHYYKNPKPPSPKGQTAHCDVCNKLFEKNKGHQRYCSRGCYESAWTKFHPDECNERQKKRRRENPDWYREREPGYYRTYRNNQIADRPWRYMFQSRRLEAKKRNIEFSLTDEWAAKRWTGRCELTDIPFALNPKGKGPFPLSATIDKIDPKKGYTPDNSRFILWGCNGLKGSGTDEDMYLIAAALIKRKPLI